MSTAPIAILGRSPKTAPLIRESTAAEVWGIGVVYRDPHIHQPGAPPLTRLYEIHPQWILADPQYDEHHFEHLLAGPHPYEIITAPAANNLTMRYYADWFGTVEAVKAWFKGHFKPIPNSRPYPLGAALALMHNVRRGGERNDFLTSSMDFCIAHAILERRERIELYGVDIETGTEWEYQRPGLAFWLGMAAAKGIEIVLPEETPVLRAKLYAVELGGQMVTRQKLEQLRGDFSNRLMAEQRQVNNIQGRLQERVDELGADPDNPALLARVEELNSEFHASLRKIERINGGFQLISFLIAECDLQEPSYELEEQATFTLG